MTSPDSDVPNVDPFIEALRSDLPGEDQERRIHARLVAAGIVAGTGLTLPGMAAAASAGANAGLLPKLAALSWGAKIGLASVVIAAGMVPVLPRVRTDEEEPGVAIWALGGQLAILFEPSEWLRFSPGIAVYRLEGEGLGVAQSLTDTAWSVSPGIEATFIAFRSLDLRVELGLQGHGSIVRPRFEIRGFGEIYRAPPFGGAAVARVAFRL